MKTSTHSVSKTHLLKNLRKWQKASEKAQWEKAEKAFKNLETGLSQGDLDKVDRSRTLPSRRQNFETALNVFKHDLQEICFLDNRSDSGDKSEDPWEIARYDYSAVGGEVKNPMLGTFHSTDDGFELTRKTRDSHSRCYTEKTYQIDEKKGLIFVKNEIHQHGPSDVNLGKYMGVPSLEKLTKTYTLDLGKNEITDYNRETEKQPYLSTFGTDPNYIMKRDGAMERISLEAKSRGW